MSSNRDFAVEQIFRADEFRADDPSPFVRPNYIKQFRTIQTQIHTQSNAAKIFYP